MNTHVLTVFETLEAIIITATTAIPEPSTSTVRVIEPIDNFEFPAITVDTGKRTNFACERKNSIKTTNFSNCSKNVLKITDKFNLYIYKFSPSFFAKIKLLIDFKKTDELPDKKNRKPLF